MFLGSLLMFSTTPLKLLLKRFHPVYYLLFSKCCASILFVQWLQCLKFLKSDLFGCQAVVARLTFTENWLISSCPQFSHQSVSSYIVSSWYLYYIISWYWFSLIFLNLAAQTLLKAYFFKKQNSAIHPQVFLAERVTFAQLKKA